MKERLKIELNKVKKEFYALLRKQGKQKIITYLYLIFSLMAITVFGLFAIRPTLGTISELHKEKEDAEFTLEQLEKKNQSLQALSSEYQQIEDELTIVNNAIPASPRIPELTRKIEVLANRNNLIIENLTTGPIELFPATRVGSPLFSYTITVTAVGEEFSINSFIQEIINIDRIMSIERITSGSAERNLFSATVTGRAFFIKE